jgi:hypothetical protein
MGLHPSFTPFTRLIIAPALSTLKLRNPFLQVNSTTLSGYSVHSAFVEAKLLPTPSEQSAFTWSQVTPPRTIHSLLQEVKAPDWSRDSQRALSLQPFSLASQELHILPFHTAFVICFADELMN